jgi:hypothetical protein
MPPVAAFVLGFALFSGGTVGLSPGDPADSVPPVTTPTQPAESPEPSTPEPAVPGVIGLGALAAALALLQRREGEISPAAGLGLQPPPDPIFVFVPGHGQPPGNVAFGDLVALLGVDEESVRYFDYRWSGGTNSHAESSEHVPIDDAAASLNAYLAGIASQGRDMYLVGFSKGGATVAELVADWDEGRWGPSRSVVGAALLDPPIAAGLLGRLQSIGRHVGPIPDDGGYDPVRCTFLGFGCSDSRAHLGEKSGVNVIVVRNPQAAITSFGDVPGSLRVYDASDGGRGPWDQLLHNPFTLVGRLSEAHESALGDPHVAACIMAEVRRPGSCDLPQRRSRPPLPGLGGGATRAPTAQKVV